MDSAAPGDRGPALVWACIVCFHPNASDLAALVRSLAPQVARVVVIDNSPGQPSLTDHELHGALHVPMTHNAGTAGGLNEAWRLALDAGATHLVSFDQDSKPDPHFVDCLMREFATAADPRLAAIGPAWTDARSGRSMRLLTPVSFIRRHVPPPATGRVEVDHIITSGCLMSARAYRDVGPFDESLFLDYVDIEWSLRARARGLFTAIAGSCRMTHRIGDHVIPLAGRQLSLHQPARSYLQVRNHLLLWRLGWIPRGWLLSDLLQVCGKLTAVLLLAPGRGERLRCIAAGIRDGLRGRGGPPSGGPQPGK